MDPKDIGAVGIAGYPSNTYGEDEFQLYLWRHRRDGSLDYEASLKLRFTLSEDYAATVAAAENLLSWAQKQVERIETRKRIERERIEALAAGPWEDPVL